MLGETVKWIVPAVCKTVQRGGINVYSSPKNISRPHTMGFGHISIRCLSMQKLTNSLALISNTPRKLAAPVNTKDPQLRFAIERISPEKTKAQTAVTLSGMNDEQPPLCIIIGWLMSKRKHVMKYANFYLDQGFDVLHVSCSPWQLLWPVTGGRVIAKDILTFMGNNQQYGPTVLHGFSVGAYVWGQLLVQMSEDPEKHQYMHNMMIGQIWDSVVDVEGCTQGIGNAVFPHNPIPRTILEAYVKFHVNTFQESVMQHYLQTSVLFHNSEIRTPSLFFSSEDDPVALYYIVERIADRWERNGCPVYWKAWKNSPHVSHMWRYPEEYKAEMKAFLSKINMLKYPDRFQVKSAARN